MKKPFSLMFACGLLAMALGARAQPAYPPLSASKPVPAELAQMVQEFNAAILSRDLDRILAFYSERYVQDGRTKRQHRSYVDGWVHLVPSFDLQLTSFRPMSDEHAFITADILAGGLRSSKAPDYQIVRENGQWKWLGNQKE